MNIKETAMNVAKKMRESVYPNPYISEAAAIDFAEALVAELAKENEPFCFVYPEIANAFAKVSCGTAYRKRSSPEQIALYTIPPTAEQIEQETAEACGKLVESDVELHRGLGNPGAAGNLMNVAMAIRPGAWEEYK